MIDLVQIANFKDNMLVLARSRVIERDMKVLDYARKSEKYNLEKEVN